MDKTHIKEKLTLHGFSLKTLDCKTLDSDVRTYKTLDGGVCVTKTLGSGVRVTALVPGSSSEGTPSKESDEDFEVLVRATREGSRLESERLCSYEEAAARYVKLLEQYRRT